MADTNLDAKLHLLATRVGSVCNTLKAQQVADKAELTTAIADAKLAVKNEILGGASAAYDTLKEIEDLMKANDDLVAALNAAKFVKFDIQDLSTEEQTQARANISAASSADMTAAQSTITTHGTRLDTAESDIDTLQNDLDDLETALGDLTNIDFVATFNTAYEPAQSGD